MDDSRAEEAARLLYAAWRDKRQISALPDSCRPQSLAEGYRVQAALAALHEAVLAGYKIGATNRAAQSMLNVEAPFFGRVFAPSILDSPARIAAGAVSIYVIEAEFDFTLKEDLPPRDAAYSLDEVMAAVDNLHPAIEIPDTRFEDLPSAGMAQLVADNAAAALLVMGPPANDWPVGDWRARDLSRQAVTVTVNGETVDEASGANVLGDPRNALVWLANTLSAHGMALEAGQVVTTGSAANVIKVEPGDTVVADFGDLGAAEARFA